MQKVYVVKQQDIEDCGACSVSSVIQYYGGYVPLEKIREDTYTTSKGTTAYHLVEALKKYGFDALGVKVDDIHEENIYFPAIAHVVLKNGLQHFVVVYQVGKNDIVLMDPAKGKVKMKVSEFITIWDNILILLTPITQIMKYDQDITVSSLLLKLISNNKAIFSKICLINLFLMVFTIASGFYFQVALSFVGQKEDMLFIKMIISFFAWLTLNKVLLSFVKNYYLTFFYKNLDVLLFSSFLEHIFHLPLKFIQNRSTGEIVTRVQELSEIKDLLAQFFTNILLNSILIIGSMVVLYTISEKLFLILCLIVFLYLVFGILFSKLLYKKVQENIEYTTDFHTVLVENIDMNGSIHHLNLVSSFLKKLEEKLILMLKSNLKTQKTLNGILLGKEFIYEIGLFLVTTCGIILISKGSLEILSLVTFNGFILYFIDPIRDFIDLLPKYYYLKASFQKLTDFLSVKEEKKEGLLSMKNGEITFEGVSYSYNGYTDILKDVSFSIASGEKVFLFGSSGKGKSTICNLICLPLCYKGIIKLAGENVADYHWRTIQNEILYVGQNEKLFTGTIKDNITCFRSCLEDELLKVIHICFLDEMASKRPNRYQTIINASINNLSGGERQRIILARALLKKAKIIILDEALSEVSLEMEKEIIRRIKENYSLSTMIYISHKNVSSEFSKVIRMEDINAANI